MDYGQHLVTTLVCFVKAEGGFCPGGGLMSTPARPVKLSLEQPSGHLAADVSRVGRSLIRMRARVFAAR